MEIMFKTRGNIQIQDLKHERTQLEAGDHLYDKYVLASLRYRGAIIWGVYTDHMTTRFCL